MISQNKIRPLFWLSLKGHQIPMKNIVAQTGITVSKIDPSLLPSVALEGRNHLPKSSGIYFAMAGAEILYIGKSISIHDRWQNHHRTNQLKAYNKVRIAWIVQSVSKEEELSELEEAYISYFKPPLNQTVIPNDLTIPGRYNKVTFYITNRQKEKLDDLAYECRKQTGKSVKQSDIVRYLIDRCNIEDLVDNI